MKEIPIDSENVKILIDTYKEIFEKEPIISGIKGVADATFLSYQGIPTVMFGPGGIDCGIHGPDERVSIDQITLFLR